MPQRTTRSRPRRSAPYDLRDRATMATTIASSMPSWPPPPYHHATVSWPDHHLHYAHQQLPPSYLPALSASIPQASLPAIIGHPSQSQPSQSAPWTTDEDQLLLDAKSQGYAWNEIHTKYFPNKSGNACRKRHERLVQKLRTTDWSEQRIQRVIQCYNEDRERLWKPLSDRLGEHWQDLERVCFQQGLRSIKISKTKHSRTRSRASSGHAGAQDIEHVSSNDEHDDSGISLGVTHHRRRSSAMSQPITTAPSSLDNILQSDDHYAYQT